MSESFTFSNAALVPESKLPTCLRCNKLVDWLRVSPNPRNPNGVTVEYQCHGETVTQEMPSSAVTNEEGLSTYTAFNDYTSGLMRGR